jgi:hypothetical protein
MDLQNIILLIGGIILLIIIIRLISKIVFKAIVLLLIVGIALYFLFFFRGGILLQDKDQFVLYSMEEQYCSTNEESAMCTCILEPLIYSIEEKYSKKELNEIQQTPLKSSRIIMEAINEKRKNIRKCLQDKNSTHLWDEFLKKIKDQTKNLNKDIKKKE